MSYRERERDLAKMVADLEARVRAIEVPRAMAGNLNPGPGADGTILTADSTAPAGASWQANAAEVLVWMGGL